MVHKPGSTNTRADPLSCLSVHEVTDSDDNREQIVLRPEHFRIAATAALDENTELLDEIRHCTEHEPDISKAVALLQSKGPRRLVNGLAEWEEENGLLYYRDKLYIPNNKELRSKVVQTCHDTALAGHPGKHGTVVVHSIFRS